MSPAEALAAVHRSAQLALARIPPKERSGAAYMIARSYLVAIAHEAGPQVAAEWAYALGDELATAWSSQ